MLLFGHSSRAFMISSSNRRGVILFSISSVNSSGQHGESKRRSVFMPAFLNSIPSSTVAMAR